MHKETRPRSASSSDARNTQPWLHHYSIQKLSGWIEEHLAHEVNRRTVEALQLALANGEERKNWPCEGGSHSEDIRPEASYPLYSFSIAYTGKDYNIPYGIQRSLVGLCRDCMEAALRVSLKGVAD